MSLDAARLPLLGNIQQPSYGSALDARAEDRSYAAEVEPRQTEQSCAVVIIPESTCDDRIFKTWAVFRRVSEFLDPNDRPSMLAVSIHRPEDVNVSFVKRLIVDGYLREQMPQKSQDAIYKFIQDPLSLESKERDHLLGIMDEYFPNLSNLSIAEENAIWLQIRENSRTLNADLDGSLTFQAVTDLHKNIVLMLRLFRATTRWDPRKDSSESMNREMEILFNNLKRDIVTFGNSANRVMAATSKVGRWETAFLFDVMKKEMEALQNLSNRFTQREFLNIHRDFHILRCAALFEQMIKTMQERQYISEETTRPLLIEVLPGEESKTYRHLLQNPMTDRWFWRPGELRELENLTILNMSNSGLTSVVRGKDNKQLLLLNLPGSDGRLSKSVRKFLDNYGMFYSKCLLVSMVAFSALIIYPLFFWLTDLVIQSDALSLLHCLLPPSMPGLELDSGSSGSGSGTVGGWSSGKFCFPSGSTATFPPLDCLHVSEELSENYYSSYAELYQNLMPLAEKCVRTVGNPTYPMIRYLFSTIAMGLISLLTLEVTDRCCK